MAHNHAFAMFVIALVFIVTSVFAMVPEVSSSIPRTLVEEDDLVNHVMLRLRGLNIRELDVRSQSDRKVIIYTRNANAQPTWARDEVNPDRDSIYGRPPMFNKEWSRFGETETIKNEKNPEFKAVFDMKYHFEEQQFLRFEVWDIHRKGKIDYVGYCETTLAGIVKSSGKLEMKILHPKRKDNGILLAESEENYVKGYFAEFRLSANISDIPMMTRLRLRKPQVYFTISSDGLETYKSEPTVMHKWKAEWPSVKVPLSRLGNGSMDKTLNVQLWTEGRSLGVASVKYLYAGLSVPLTTPNKNKKPGSLRFDSWNVVRAQTFVEFLPDIDFVTSVAIDWTGANGNPNPRGTLGEINPVFDSSLHYRNPVYGKFNPYERSIYSVVSVLEDYNSGDLIPTYGFGGLTDTIWHKNIVLGPNDIDTYHYARSKPLMRLFALNGDGEKPGVIGRKGILEAYSKALRDVRLNGHTHFSPAIKQAMDMARMGPNNKYHILMIITARANTDMVETIDAIVEASVHPLSIIIVGVGNADFSNMRQLDDGNHGGLLKDSKGNFAARDIVQFVSMNELLHQNQLNKKALKDIPDQVLSYMEMRRILPRNPQHE